LSVREAAVVVPSDVVPAAPLIPPPPPHAATMPGMDRKAPPAAARLINSSRV